MSAKQPDFENLRRLLKLKRYEKPPPRYFNDFSTQVVNAIRNGAQAEPESFGEQLATGLPWLERFLTGFQSKPVMAGLFGAAVCVLVVAGITYSERPQTSAQFGNLVIGGQQPAALLPAATTFGNDTTLAVSSSNHVSPRDGSIFDALITPMSPTPVNWKPGGN